MLLPDDIDISERSRRFYDGTYTLTSEGFVDELGVYRAFDCCDPAARAPTPLPPMFLLDGRPLGEDDPVDIGTRRGQTQGPAPFTFASVSTGGTPITILQDGFFRGHDERERLLGKMEGIQLASRQQGIDISQAECYRLCRIPYPGVVGSTASTSCEQGTMLLQDSGTVETLGKKASVSPLSECPSDLSDWEGSRKATSAKQATESKVQVQDESRAKRTTRGVAQKVGKTPKKSTAGPALVSRAQEGGRARRQSARQAKTYIYN